MSGIKKIKINGQPNKKYVALFRRDDNSMHLLLCGDIDCTADSEMSYNDDIFVLVTAPTFAELMVGKNKDNNKMKTVCDFWEDEWDA